MIAAVTWRHGATLLAQDADLRRIAAVVAIGLDAAAPGVRGQPLGVGVACGGCGPHPAG